MSIRGLFVVLAALICGASAVVGVTRLHAARGVDSPAQADTSQVVVVATNVPRGRTITREDVEVRQWPKDVVPAGTVATVEDAMGRAATVPLVAGEPLLNAKLAPKDAGRGLAALVPKGMRAYAIQVSRLSSGVAGFILPGNKVDVLLNLRGTQAEESGGAATVTLLQSVEILAVDQLLDAPADNRVSPKDMGSVTLLVTPEQASLLDLGQNMGQLTLSLCNPDDADHSTATPATLAGIRPGGEKPAKKIAAPEPKPAPSPAPTVIEAPARYEIVTLRGGVRGVVVVETKR
jgi:pilus assembly protein CpaB